MFRTKVSTLIQFRYTGSLIISIVNRVMKMFDVSFDSDELAALGRKFDGFCSCFRSSWGQEPGEIMRTEFARCILAQAVDKKIGREKRTTPWAIGLSIDHGIDIGGPCQNRTDDPLRAKQVLSQHELTARE